MVNVITITLIMILIIVAYREEDLPSAVKTKAQQSRLTSSNIGRSTADASQPDSTNLYFVKSVFRV